MQCREVWQKFTGVSEECAEEYFTLKMETSLSLETSANFRQTIRRHILDDSIF
jgi:hypothetical protein